MAFKFERYQGPPWTELPRLRTRLRMYSANVGYTGFASAEKIRSSTGSERLGALPH